MTLSKLDITAAAITAPLIAAYFVLPVAIWFALTVLVVLGIAGATGLNRR